MGAGSTKLGGWGNFGSELGDEGRVGMTTGSVVLVQGFGRMTHLDGMEAEAGRMRHLGVGGEAEAVN